MSAAYYRGSDGLLHRAKNVHIDGGPARPVVEPLTVDRNGVYTPDPGVDGYNPVNVDVPERTPVIKALEIIKNGVTPLPSDADGYGPVTVAVPSDKKPEESYDRTYTANGNYPIIPTPGSVISGGSIKVQVTTGGGIDIPGAARSKTTSFTPPDGSTSQVTITDLDDMIGVLVLCTDPNIAAVRFGAALLYDPKGLLPGQEYKVNYASPLTTDGSWEADGGYLYYKDGIIRIQDNFGSNAQFVRGVKHNVIQLYSK